MKKILVLLFLFVFISILSINSVNASVDLLDGLVSYWDGSYSSTTAIDVHGTNNGTASNSRVFGTDGKILKGFDFTKGADNIVLPTARTILGTNPSEWSFGGWFKTTATTDQHIFSNYASGGGYRHIGLLRIDTNGKVQINIDTGTVNSFIVSNNTYRDGNWSHIFATFSKTTNEIKLYINGELEGTTTMPSTSIDFTDGLNPFYIGSWQSGGYLNGLADEVAIYNRTLSSDEVEALYEGQYPFQSNFTIKSKEYSGRKLLNFSSIVDGDYYNTTTGTIISGINESKIINASLSGTDTNAYINVDYVDYNTSENIIFNYSILDITAKNNRTGEDITVINASFSLEGNTYYTNETFYLNTGEYNITVESIGYAPYNFLINLSEGINNYEASMFTANSLLIYIYNATSGSLLDNNVTIEAELLDSITTYNTTTGELFLNLTEGEYYFTFFSEGFQNTYYITTIGNNSFQKIDIYMAEDEEETTIFTFKDKDTSEVLEGVTLSIKRLIEGKWVIVNALKSDISGKVTFTYKENLRYKFTVTGNSYTTRDFELNPIIFNNYNIFLERVAEVDQPIFQRVSTSVSPYIFFNNKNNSIEINIASATGSLESYGYNISFKNIVNVSDVGYNAYGELFSETIEIIGAKFGDKIYINYYYTLSNDDYENRTLVFSIMDSEVTGGRLMSSGDHYGMGFFERSLIVTVISLLVGSMAFVFGGIVMSGTSILLIMGYFLFIGFLSGWILIPSMIFIVIAVLWRATQ